MAVNGSRARVPVRSIMALVLAICASLVLSTLPALAANVTAGPYIALGDSYASGPFIPNQELNPLGCGRSDHDYPSLVAAAIKPASFHDVSCGAAMTDHMTSPQPVLLGTNPPQFDALTQDTTLVTITIGGNDIGFGSIAQNCVSRDLLSPDGSPCKDYYTTGGVDQLAAAVSATAPKIAAVLQGIHQRAPHAVVLVVGYPDILPESGPGCWPLVPISSGDVPYLRGVEHQLNDMLAGQAAAGGARFVDTYTSSIGHDVCQLPGVKWVEGIIPTAPAYPIHPNELGMENDARDVIAAIG